ncbi:HD domain-containing protein 2-like [Carassius auratus]|uniref:HD domain-containing protein 2-like n=1 Tax=Carassius auratus TaxID=7957 RepID=A0A6P6KEN7_CARAU|nr:HD domain-containing protein 2-like [Carassius auratus]
MIRMSMMALTIQDVTDSDNKERCMKLALVHDLAECIVGDIAPADVSKNVSKAEKHRREREAMVHITGLLDYGLRKEIYNLWEKGSIIRRCWVW